MKFSIRTLGRSIVAVLGLCWLSGCTNSSGEVPLRSLQAAGAVSFVCVGPAGVGKDIRECPDRTSPLSLQNRMLGLVTQTLTGEVAVIDVTRGGVVDVNPSVPGFSFLAVGARPADIVSTPDGQASFVAVAEPGREGIFALPTSCIENSSDISEFPACALPSAPKKLLLLTDPARPDGSVRRSCLSTEPELGPPAAASRQACPADLTRSSFPFAGRRKLLVLLPDQGAVAVLDAQAIVDRNAGSFAPCEIEAWLPLSSERPIGGLEQPLPLDLSLVPGTVSAQRYDLAGTGFVSRPSDVALADSTLYISDSGAPVIHRLDVTDPCLPVEQPPLLPTSLRRPERLVTTTKVAVSPLTANLERFLYAIDDGDEPAASVMIFDVSAKSRQQTPLVRAGSARMPLEDADRISFTAPAADVVFANHDVPVTGPTGIGVWGTRCNPDPALSSTDLPEVKYRPASNLRSGAGPTPLRGTFGFVLLANGQIAVLDVDDADADCRRPLATQKSSIENFRGCKSDAADLPPFLSNDRTRDGAPTVTNEVSCHVVEPHRVRSAQTMVNRTDFGVRAPALTQFPTLTQFGVRLSTSSQTDTGKTHPKLLPVQYPGSGSAPCVGDACAQVFVNTTLYTTEPSASNLLDLEPSSAERNAITLPLNQPRSFPSAENVALTFEGAVGGVSSTGVLKPNAGALTVLEDENGLFCAQGVQSQALMRVLGAEKFELAGPALSGFATEYADYVQLVSDVPNAEDPYWKSAQASSCSYVACREFFGAPDSQILEVSRDFRIEEAHEGELSVTPRQGDVALASSQAACCFPGPVSYVVRGGKQWVLQGSSGGFRHRVVGKQSQAGRFECVLGTDPGKAFFEGRAFEVSPFGTAATPGEVCINPIVGTAGTVGGPLPAESACVFNGLTARFAVYRGTSPSERDMLFTWRTIGGFSPMFLSFGGLEASSGRVLPVALEHISGLGELGIVDGSTLGLSLIDLTTPQGRSVSYY